MNGINLGGWLVTEKWITPSLYGEFNDEFNLSLSKEGKAALTKHYDTFIQAKDFAWIAEKGFKVVRLPVGYGLFGDAEPFNKTVGYVDKAFKWAEKYDLKILLDLHTALGSQNGHDHSGKAGETGWHTDPANIEATISTVSKIAHRYKNNQQLWGIELLNEPDKFIPLKLLQDYYRRAYDAVRQQCGDHVTVVISDAYRPMVEWEDLLQQSSNMLLDVHMYQLYKPADQKLSLEQHVSKAISWQKKLELFGPEKIIVGEWSAALQNTYENLQDPTKKQARELYMQAQRFAFAQTAAHFYWTYKTEDGGIWSYKNHRL